MHNRKSKNDASAQSFHFKLHDAACERDERVLFRGVNLSVSPGDLFHIEGPNGVGKTTLLRGIVGLFAPMEGHLTWYLADGVESNQGMYSYWGHQLAFNHELSALNNLAWSVRLRRAVDQGEMADALAQVGLTGYGHVSLQEMSAGQKQRVAMARLALENSRVWFLDEPFSSLDSEGVRLLEERLAIHIHQGGSAVITSHQAVAVGGLQRLRLTQDGLIDQQSGEKC